MFKHDINDIQLATGLKQPFIRKCVKTLPDLFQSEIIRSDKNKMLFSDNALVILDQIKQYKHDRLTINEMKVRLYAGKKSEKVEPTTKETKRTSQTVELYERLLADKDKALSDKESLIQRQQAEIEQLKEQLKLLTYERQESNKHESNPVKAILKRIFR
ncbi:hypothetical protein [Candidatus Magnetominusculus xianensis]|uniref:Uncharacterized protein n=1 Tax=Candidatus Magnetominusculus xianensis TaxID=1748249 RepID=A0ABR5SF44_9BACT|nr:hypothetical protein [Candidatus Magnetominusculus xianensis]KWT85471.1 hypothetical protein ASN18_1723 [Candidatus Magnetominusculus xianensis]